MTINDDVEDVCLTQGEPEKEALRIRIMLCHMIATFTSPIASAYTTYWQCMQVQPRTVLR